jgi:hypothetical protein
VAPGRSPAECALLFESLGKKEEDVFFHCDQFIRGMYSVFLEHWFANFPRENVMVGGAGLGLPAAVKCALMCGGAGEVLKHTVCQHATCCARIALHGPSLCTGSLTTRLSPLLLNPAQPPAYSPLVTSPPPPPDTQVIRSEDYYANETLWVAKAIKFLGLPEPDQQLWSSISVQHKPKSNIHGRIIMPIAEDALNKMYQPWNERLANVMQVRVRGRGAVLAD